MSATTCCCRSVIAVRLSIVTFTMTAILPRHGTAYH